MTSAIIKPPGCAAPPAVQPGPDLSAPAGAALTVQHPGGVNHPSPPGAGTAPESPRGFGAQAEDAAPVSVPAASPGAPVPDGKAVPPPAPVRGGTAPQAPAPVTSDHAGAGSDAAGGASERANVPPAAATPGLSGQAFRDAVRAEQARQAKTRRNRRGGPRTAPGYQPGMNRRLPPGGAS